MIQKEGPHTVLGALKLSRLNSIKNYHYDRFSANVIGSMHQCALCEEPQHQTDCTERNMIVVNNKFKAAEKMQYKSLAIAHSPLGWQLVQCTC